MPYGWWLLLHGTSCQYLGVVERTVLSMDRPVHHLVKLCQRISLDFRGKSWPPADAPEEDEDDDVEQEELVSGGDDENSGMSSFDLVSPYHDIDLQNRASSRDSSPTMGQRPSHLWARPKISLTWALKPDMTLIQNNNNNNNHKLSSQEHQAVRKHNNLEKCGKNSNVLQKWSGEGGKVKSDSVGSLSKDRSVSPASSTSTTRPGRRRRMRRSRQRAEKTGAGFGYEIQDVDEFLTKASLDSPANIPMVLSRPCVLYETHTGGHQREVSLPLGMVVNGVLKNRAWLYAQTPHGEEGYVPYACCLPLGILPPPARPQPCWDTQTDIFPRPSGNRTDTEKMRDGTKSECGLRPATNRKRIRRDSGERSVDGLYLRASRKPPTRHTLLVIGSDYTSPGRSALSVCKGDVVSLVSSHLNDWFWVRDRDGKEGFIPAVVAGHGFL